ncbi:N-acetyl-gamma-glutamyl-phosphate reductase [candidate division KSB3 bacterium]|uniref:N-acetyl-gamma-glutamyl-phosphate reductase n=1 Tax=candidate division KSB3 bacterium TaxID=2044937 RepID=A0A2G6KJP2_9BACT|nr:MAG: N-acetyl-gamma-glutamyl-phosphate reductase [candidate division KSB3 bacterium]
MGHSTNTLQTAIIGASGYSGVELVKLLLNHPQVSLAHIIGSSTVGQRLDDVYPFFRKKTDLVVEALNVEVLKDMDIVFMALPHGEAMKQVPQLVDAGIRVIDFSGDFRFKSADVYEQWYKLPHTAAEYLEHAVYGLPELFKEEIQRARLLANPGCYPTGAILALAPILSLSSVVTDFIAISSMSGTSGAGRKANLGLIFSEVNETVKAYRVGNHQHTPEIKMMLEQVAGRELRLVFIPHLIPMTRGIYSTVCLPLKKTVAQEELIQHYQNFYQDAPFVRVLDDRPPEIKFVTHTNYCDIHVTIDQTQQFVAITSTIDNLVKGAAGQAMQNMNLMAGFPEEEGLS